MLLHHNKLSSTHYMVHGAIPVWEVHGLSLCAVMKTPVLVPGRICPINKVCSLGVINVGFGTRPVYRGVLIRGVPLKENY